MRRYDNLDEVEAGRHDAMFECPDGDRVRYEDVAQLIEALRAIWANPGGNGYYAGAGEIARAALEKAGVK